MDRYSLAGLTDGALLTGLKANLARERDALALVLAHIAETEERELFKPAGYSSMHMYCVHELHLSKDAANKRLRAARTAREFPVVFEKVEQGAIRLTSLLILASELTPENAEELLTASAFRSDFEVREILAERFPQAPVPTTIVRIVEPMTLDSSQGSVCEHAVVAAQPLQRVVNPLRVRPMAPGLYKATLTMSRAMHEKLRRAIELLGYRKSVPDEAEVLEAGLDLFIAELEKRKFGATDRPRAARRSKAPGHVSNAVKRKVWERDGGRCTFDSENGTRCPEKSSLEWDHIVPVARGGASEPSNVRLRCRAHNQLEAQRVYGNEFMKHKREQAKAAAATRRLQEKEAQKAERETLDTDEVLAWLRSLGFSASDAELAVSQCPPRPTALPGTRRLMCLAFLRERPAPTGT